MYYWNQQHSFSTTVKTLTNSTTQDFMQHLY